MSVLHAAAKPGVPVFCSGCGQRYPQDPPFEVACPECGAKPGAYCIRPSEHQGPFVPFHAARDVLANEQGFYGPPCTGAPGAGAPQTSLF